VVVSFRSFLAYRIDLADAAVVNGEEEEAERVAVVVGHNSSSFLVEVVVEVESFLPSSSYYSHH
jgi:hypothetical protein